MTFNQYIATRAKPASSYKSYEAYCKARKAEGLQVIPRSLYKSLKGSKS